MDNRLTYEMKNNPNLWYAVLRDQEDDWGTGSTAYDEAVEMLREQGYGLIAVIDNNPRCPLCLGEIYYKDII